MTREMLPMPASVRKKKKGQGRIRWFTWARIHHENDGAVLCYVCARHVPWSEATLEHILPKVYGGTSYPVNLAISHAPCNRFRGSPRPGAEAERPR